LPLRHHLSSPGADQPAILSRRHSTSSFLPSHRTGSLSFPLSLHSSMCVLFVHPLNPAPWVACVHMLLHSRCQWHRHLDEMFDPCASSVVLALVRSMQIARVQIVAVVHDAERVHAAHILAHPQHQRQRLQHRQHRHRHHPAIRRWPWQHVV